MMRFVVEVNVPEGTDASAFASLIEMFLSCDMDYPDPDPTVWSSPEDYVLDYSEYGQEARDRYREMEIQAGDDYR